MGIVAYHVVLSLIIHEQCVVSFMSNEWYHGCLLSLAIHEAPRAYKTLSTKGEAHKESVRGSVSVRARLALEHQSLSLEH